MDPAHSIPVPVEPEQAEKSYLEALNQFRELQQKLTRKSVCGRQFVLVPAFTQDLERPFSAPDGHGRIHILDRLRVFSYIHFTRWPCEIGLETLQSCRAIFYTLVEIGSPHLVHYFFEAEVLDNSLPLSQDKIIQATNRVPFGSEEERDEFHQRFLVEQYKWCPMMFDVNELHCNGRIAPIYRSSLIKQTGQYARDPVPSGNEAVLLIVEVPEELVTPELQAKLPGPKERVFENEQDPIETNIGLRYVFVLKKFLDPNRYSHEKTMLKALNGREGIIEYFGGFTTQIKDHNGKSVEYCHLMLELAQGDLYQALIDESPPTLPGEIKRWWTEMLHIAKAIRSVHDDLTPDNIPFDMWHCDVKPENILRVDDHFKLSDPGEAVIKLATGIKDGEPTARARRGTKAFAAPEKAALQNSAPQDNQGLSKNIDIWSLGCIFSMAGTFVVHGSTGVQQYNQIRRRQTLKDSGNLRDAEHFHNGTVVLGVVKDWHGYLRATLRNTDFYTPKILDLVENHMLVESARRSSANEICVMLQEILDVDIGFPSVSDNIIEMLQQVELQEDVRHEVFRGFKPAESLSRVNTGLPAVQVPPGPAPSTETKLFGSPIPPTSQRQLPEEFRPSRTATGSSSVSSHRTISKRSMTGYSFETVKSSSSATYRPVDSPRKPFTIWAMELWLKDIQKQRGLPALRRIRSIIKRGKDHQPVKQDNALWATETDCLKGFLEKRDIVFIVDNGSSMYDEWLQVQHLVKVLVWRLLGYDDDGMEMYFTNPPSQLAEGIKPDPKQEVHDFERAMQEAAPTKDKRHLTSLWQILNTEMSNYIGSDGSKWPNQPRSKTIIVITDGAWLGHDSDDLVDHVIKANLDILLSRHRAPARQRLSVSTSDDVRAQAVRKLEESDNRPITIQFIQVGHNPDGLRRLRRLDDDIAKEGYYPDLIDMEPANGDANKMILGSLSRQMDKKITVVSSIPCEPEKPSSETSPTLQQLEPMLSRGDTSPSPVTSPRSPHYLTAPTPDNFSPYTTVSSGLSGSPQPHLSLNIPHSGVHNHVSSPVESPRVVP